MQAKSMLESAEWVLAAIKNLEQHGKITILHTAEGIQVFIYDKKTFDVIPLQESYNKRESDMYPFVAMKQSGGIKFYTLLTAKEHIQRLAGVEREVC